MEYKRGILTIAHTKQKYVRQAVNLALSIKNSNPKMPIAVVTNLHTEDFNQLFDQVINWDFSNIPGLIAKLSIYEMSPFQETMFLDADCLVIKPLHHVFDYFSSEEFAVFGINKENPSWFQDIKLINQEVPSKTYPGFNGGLYYFKKTNFAKSIFEDARALLPKYDQLKINYFGKYPGDEPLVSLAMAQAGLKAKNNSSLDILFAPAGRRGKIKIDVLGGECSFNKYGRIVKPYIMHFASDDTCFEYLREELKLRASFDNNLSTVVQLLLTSWAWSKWLFIRFIPLYSLFAKNKLKKVING